jgi:hypothetical protein
MNPFLGWLGPLAQTVRAQRQALPADDPMRKLEKLNAELFSASLDFYRAVRDARSEAAFFSIYANMFGVYMEEQSDADAARDGVASAERQQALVKGALARISQGGYTEAFARIAYLLARRKGEPLPLSRVTMRQELAKEYAGLVPDIAIDQWRRIRGEQEIIVEHEPERAITTLPDLLDLEERERLLTLIERVVTDKRVLAEKPTAEQMEMVERVRNVLSPASSKGEAATVELTVQRMKGSRREPQA